MAPCYSTEYPLEEPFWGRSPAKGGHRERDSCETSMASQCSIWYMLNWCNRNKIHFYIYIVISQVHVWWIHLTYILSCLSPYLEDYFPPSHAMMYAYENYLFTYENHQQKKILKAMRSTFITESLIKSSSATSSNSDIGFSDNPKQILPLVSNLIWPVTWQ